MKNGIRFKIIGLVICSIIAVGHIQAQEETKVGIRAGVLISKQAFDNGNLDEDVKSKFGGDLALVADFPLGGEVISISPELHWLQKGAKIKDININGNLVDVSKTFNYLELPVMLKLHFGTDVGFMLFGGPSVGYLLDGKDKDNDGMTNDIDLDFYKRLELGAHVGGGIVLGPLVVDIRYIFGLSNISDSEIQVKNRSLGGGVSLMF